MLRHVDAPLASPVATGSARPELVVLVGGYQSCACPDDGTFDALRTRLAASGEYAVVRFGADPRFPYDTSGSIDTSAVNLRDQVRALAGSYGGVHIVTHSMGGVVADRAFAHGLSSDDGVITYVSWSAPHDGSDAALALLVTGALTPRDTDPLRGGAGWMHMDADTRAMRDLALARAVPPPHGVVRLDLREATDVLVTERDARDPGVASRTLTGAAEGHGGILNDPEAIDLTLATIATRRIPPDRRSLEKRLAADETSHRAGQLILLALCVLTIAAIVAAASGQASAAPRYIERIRRKVPSLARPPCP